MYFVIPALSLVSITWLMTNFELLSIQEGKIGARAQRFEAFGDKKRASLGPPLSGLAWKMTGMQVGEIPSTHDLRNFSPSFLDDTFAALFQDRRPSVQRIIKDRGE